MTPDGGFEGIQSRFYILTNSDWYGCLSTQRGIEMKIKINAEEKIQLQEGMIGLFFEDINYAADGGLYAEMLENRCFEFMKATGMPETT